MLVKTDNEGNKLHSTFIGDAQYNVSEGLVSVNSVYASNVGTYKFTFNIGSGIKLLSYEFDEDLQILDTVTIKTDSTARTKKLCSVYTEDYIYIGGQYLPDFSEYLVKYDNDGNVIAETERIDHIGIGNLIINNNVIIAAGLMSNNNHNWIVQKLDTSLNIIWQKTYGRNIMINGTQIFIASSPDSCYVMSGLYPVCYADRFQEKISNAACVRKIDDDGNLLWEKIIKNYYLDYFHGLGLHRVECTYDLYVDNDGYIYVAGQGTNLSTGLAGFLTKLSSDGNIMFRRYYTPDGSKNGPTVYLNSVKPTPDGGLIMGGYTYDSYYTAVDFGDYYQQPWLVKTDMDGLDGLCYTELPELYLDVFIPDTVCNLDTIDCVVNISGPSAPYTLEFSTGQVIENIYYPDVFVPREIGIDTVIVGNENLLYQYTETITEATLKDTAIENIIAKHYNIATPTYSGNQQLTITLTDFYGNTKTIYKDIYVNPCHEVEVDENENVVLSVYPNPATEYINISGENIAGIEICNLLGEVVYEMQQCNGNNVISTDGMGAGSYFVRVRMEDGKVVTKKIVVM
ncbi:MAG: T9SS type A sorting domain-containing protein [Bacteroidales bacterium]|nr:T9SS type A sorting domain-containing protein [Bacteroidales bacterium]